MTEEQRELWLARLAFYIGEEENGQVLIPQRDLQELYDLLYADNKEAT